MHRSLPLVNGWSTFRLCLAAFLEVLGSVESTVLRGEFRQRVCVRRIDRKMWGGQRRFDSEWPTGGYFLSHLDASLQGLVARRGNFLQRSHAQGLLRAPVIPRQHVSHGVSPSCFAHESDGRAATREATVGILILTEARVGRGYADIGGEVEFVAHVPGVAMDNGEQRLREDGRRSGQGVDGAALSDTRSIGCYSCLKGIDVNASGKVIPMSEQHGRAQRRIMVVLIVGLGQSVVSLGIDPIVDVWAIDADQDDLPTALHRDLRG